MRLAEHLVPIAHEPLLLIALHTLETLIGVDMCVDVVHVGDEGLSLLDAKGMAARRHLFLGPQNHLLRIQAQRAPAKFFATQRK